MGRRPTDKEAAADQNAAPSCPTTRIYDKGVIQGSSMAAGHIPMQLAMAGSVYVRTRDTEAANAAAKQSSPKRRE